MMSMARYGIAACVCFVAAAAFGDALIRRAKEPIPNRYIVVLNDAKVSRDSVPAAATEMALAHGGRVLAAFRTGLRGFGVEMPEQRVQRLAADPRVSWIEEDAAGYESVDTRYFADDTYWHLDRIDQRTPVPQWPTKAYAWTSTGQGVNVYVVDSGIWSAHTEFSNGNVTAGTSTANSPDDPYPPTSPCGGGFNGYRGGHGTAVASLIGGRTVGVAPGATLIPVKVSQCFRNHSAIEPETRTDAISVLWALDWIQSQIQANPAQRAVVNFSIFFTPTDPDPNQIAGCYDPVRGVYDCMPALEHNIRNVMNSGTYGTVVVAAAGNKSSNVCGQLERQSDGSYELVRGESPARFGYGGFYDDGSQPNLPFVITVGGTDINDARYTCASCAWWDSGSNYGRCVDIYAPAKNIHAAHLAATDAYRDNLQYVTEFNADWSTNLTVEWVSSGTSFAAPITTGVVARLLQTFPSMTARQVWENLRANATTLASNFDGDNNPNNDRLIYISPYN